MSLSKALDREIVGEIQQQFRSLHRRPGLSGEEGAAASIVQKSLAESGFVDVLTGLGGHGVAGVLEGSAQGPTILLRSELDALPIKEASGLPYSSGTENVAHLCGHDGHTAILLAVARATARRGLSSGKLVVLFQPAEEVGTGAQAVLEDHRFEDLEPDYAYGLHNLPGFEMGKILLKNDTFCCASRGLEIVLSGRTAHAAQPETGLNPSSAIAEILSALPPQASSPNGTPILDFSTVVGVELGGANYGVSPGEGTIHLTLRASTDQDLDSMEQSVRELARSVAENHSLKQEIRVHDPFAATVNDDAAVTRLEQIAGERAQRAPEPFRWSEDFGHFLKLYPGAFFGIGAGQGAALHDPAYVFPEELIELGAQFWLELLEEHLG